MSTAIPVSSTASTKEKQASSDISSQDWTYSANTSSRDLRIDLLRGLIMLIVITVHMEYFSIFSFFVWERLGVISSAEGFVALSGVVLGMVYRKKLQKDGFNACAGKLINRATQLYRINLFMIIAIAGLNLLPFLDAFTVMNFVEPGSGKVYPLYPPIEAGWKDFIGRAILLRSGSHQFQVIGLYVVLMALAPVIFWLITQGRIKLLLGLSWAIYIINWAYPSRITGAQFEYAFPLFTWQLIFTHAISAGYFKESILEYFSGTRGKLLIVIAATLALGFLFFTLNNPNPNFPAWSRIRFLTPEVFYTLHDDYFQKSKLGIGRLLNNLCLFIILFSILTRYWLPINKLIGWLLIPIGQASLYVFILHVYFVLLFSLTPLHELNNFWANTLMHTTAIGVIWLMIKNKFMFRWIPR